MSQSVSLLPRTPHTNARAAAQQAQRDRLVVALVDVVADKGYAAATVADVIAGARMSRRSFYEHFDSKEACFLAAYDAGIDSLMTHMAERVEAADDWLDGVTGALRAFLELLAGEPGFARIAFVESLTAGPAASERYWAVADRFRDLLRTFHEQARAADPAIAPASELMLESVAGGINRVLTRRVLTGRGAELPELVDEVLAFGLRVLAAREEGQRLPPG